ncbi:MAG TPA: SGNH/GDSL hydrolase family protein [Bacteroidales bacterium]|nr:SGNH/GDSL hydrolase family protein [Bacteroidales bacterium]HRU56947.1 SGNH/GDSL hydrolase family protein [Bacteroidales bacterium]
MKINLTFSFFFILVITAVSCQHTKQTWVGTWSCAPQLVEPHNMPPEPGLTNSTLRQVVRVSIGGDSVRVRFSNEFSSSPVTIRKANIALSAGGSKIDASTITMLTFNNNQEVTMEPGMAVTSDPVAFRIKPRTDIAITIFFGTTSPDVTGHPGSRTTSYLISGDHTSMPELSDAATADRWYIINGIDVKASDKAASIVVIGNSITDGRGSGTNKQNRWPDILAERLIQNPATSNVAVLNQGIGGNCVLRPCLGPSALDRFERDVLRQHGVHWLIILEGINDIGQAPDSTAAISIADNLITAYKQMTEKAHSSGIKVYGATILPFKDSFYYTDFREAARRKVNEWIRQNNYFDAIIDFDMIMRNPEDTLSLLPETHTGDFLHPNEKGYQIMGESIDLKLFIK